MSVRLNRKKSEFFKAKKFSGNLIDLATLNFKNAFRISDDELDYILAHCSDDELDTLLKVTNPDHTISEKKQCIATLNILLCAYKKNHAYVN